MRINLIEDTIDEGLYLSNSYKLGNSGYVGVSARNRARYLTTSTPNVYLEHYCLANDYKYIPMKEKEIPFTLKEKVNIEPILLLLVFFETYCSRNQTAEINQVFLKVLIKLIKEPYKIQSNQRDKVLYLTKLFYETGFSTNKTEDLEEIEFKLYMSLSKHRKYKKLKSTIQKPETQNVFMPLIDYINGFKNLTKKGNRTDDKYIKFKQKNKNVLCYFLAVPATTVDHKIPISKGGTNDESNLIMLSDVENNLKGSIDWDSYVKLTEKYFLILNKEYREIYF